MASLAAACLALPLALSCQAQTTPAPPGQDPTLQKRTSPTPAIKPTRPTGTSQLPKDASGEYLLDEAGSVVQITLEPTQLTGYVTRMGDDQSDKDTPLTYFFDQATAQGNTLSFTTKKVHGVWYSFTGTIVRGDAGATRDENGYYRLKGAWTTHDDTRRTETKQQEVSLKSTPRKP